MVIISIFPKKQLNKFLIIGLSLLLLPPLVSNDTNTPYKPAQVKATEIFEINSTSNISSFDSVQLIGGLGFTAILKEDGSVWTFGRNDLGQLGLEDKIDRSSPTRIDPSYFNNEKVIKIDAASVNVIALTESRRVYYWGSGATKPTLIYNNLPVLDVEMGGFTDVNAHQTTHILTNDGYVRSSYSNYFGQFGDGQNDYGSKGICNNEYVVPMHDFTRITLTSAQFENCSVPTYKKLIKGTEKPLSNVVSISNDLNKRYSMALTIDKDIYVWGEGYPNFATKINGSSSYKIKKIEASKYPTFLTDDGKVFYYPNRTKEPVELKLENSNAKIVDIKSGFENLILLDENGRVYGLGPNNYGSLGTSIPYQGVNWGNNVAIYTGFKDVKRIGTGMNVTLLQYINGTFATVGRNNYGQLSTKDKNTKTSFILNPSIKNVKDISSVYYSSFAVTNDNKLYSWGGTNAGERLGRDTDFNIPVMVKDFSGIGPIKEINGFSTFSIHGGILLENGGYWTYGNPWKNGIGRTGAPYTPMKLENTNSKITNEDFNIITASQGRNTGIAISKNNNVFTWGYDINGLLGLGYEVNETVSGALEPAGLLAFQEAVLPKNEKYINVYSGSYENLVLTESGKVFAWGDNSYLRYGLPNSVYLIPTLVNTLPPIKSIATGMNHNLFLDFEGNVWAAGDNSLGQLGIGNTKTPSIPTKIPSLSKVTFISAGLYSSYAVLQNGEVLSWGDNRYGQLGLNDLNQRNEPRKVPGITDVKKVTGGLKHAMVLTNKGELYTTGSDGEGQLGLNQSQINEIPVPVVFPLNVKFKTPTNQIFGVNDTLSVQGEIYSETPNVPTDVYYELESQTMSKNTLFKSYVSKNTSEPFSFNIPFNDTFRPGSYILKVKALSNTGVSGEAILNFTIQDTIPPTINVDVTSSPQWTKQPVKVRVSADDTGGSGYRGFRYAITDSITKPTQWSSIQPEKAGEVIINKSGKLYLHLEAFDNIGNSTYKNTGIYYMDLDPPEITFSEPDKWQQDRLKLGIKIYDLSNIVERKWIDGIKSKDEVKKDGTSFTGDFIDINKNGNYTIYARDENNYETIKSINVTHINYQPKLNNINKEIIIPAISKDNFALPSSFSHNEQEDPVKLVLQTNSLKFESKNSYSDIASDSTRPWFIDFSNLQENTIYSGITSIFDSRNGKSNSIDVKLEIYNPKVQIKTTYNAINISWEHSNINKQYRLKRNGQIIYTGSDNKFVDSTISNNQSYTYTLEVLDINKYIEVFSTQKSSGIYNFVTPSLIQFPTISLNSNQSVSPSAMDKEYIEYKENVDIPTTYSLKVSMTDFISNNGIKFTPDEFLFKNLSRLNEFHQTQQQLINIGIHSIPQELFRSSSLKNSSYFKLELLKDDIQLRLPKSIKLNQSQKETVFNASIIWDLEIAP
ncbi:RCC1 domain-containing protein [Bacillus sp. Brlt_9]|uniref:RCC1 domain-containing protein n=1 Tax=Bacillus sp. Brlt_9 TaxID=3110916 RepID=UPI003F7B8528